MNQKIITLKELQKRYNDGEKFDFHFFWNGPFSQWKHSVFTVENVEHTSAEQYMMAQKALLFNDKESYDEIMSTNRPATQKLIGKKVKNFDENIWYENRIKIVCRDNWHKFTQNPDLLKKLLNTGNKILVESSPVDKMWGIGLSSIDPRANNPLKWKGENLLGFTLTCVRDTYNEVIGG